VFKAMDVVTDDPVLDEPTLHDAIVHRAHELWELRGRVDGHADEDWAQAEAEVRKRFSQPGVALPAFLSVKGQRFVYTCLYDRNCTDYRPGDIAPGQIIHFRVAEGKLYLKLPDDRELETLITDKVEVAP
jgi:DUF2934 family protein